MMELHFIVLVILFVIRIGVILNSWHRVSHGQESTLLQNVAVFICTDRPARVVREDVGGPSPFDNA